MVGQSLRAAEPKSVPALQSKNLEQKVAKIWGEDFTLIVKKGTPKTKFTIVVSKKVAKLAVDRNRIKRLFKEALRSLNYQDQDLAIIVRKNIAGHKMDQVKGALKKLIEKNV